MATNLGFEPQNKKPYFFVSYNTEDAHRIAPIVTTLFTNGVPLWYDRGLMAGSEAWEQQIAEKIDCCEAVIMFITRGILRKAKNSFVHVEYQLAKVFSQKPVYVVLLDNIQMEEVPLDLRVWWLELMSNQCITFGPNDTPWAQSAEILRNLSLRFDLFAHRIAQLKPKRELCDVDIVCCVCRSASAAPTIRNIRTAVKTLPELIRCLLREEGFSVLNMRARIIAFGNYQLSEEGGAMLVTDFFDLNKQEKAYIDCVNSIHPENTEFNESNALEALAYAIHSNWKETPLSTRQYIFLWLPEGCVPLQKHAHLPNYPKGMAADTTELLRWWRSKPDQDGKRLFIFPSVEAYSSLDFLTLWEKTAAFCPDGIYERTEDPIPDLYKLIATWEKDFVTST